MTRRPFGLEGGPVFGQEPPKPELTSDDVLARRIERVEIERSPERRDDAARLDWILGKEALLSLLAVIGEVEKIRNLERESAKTLEHYRELTPKLGETLLTPQSPDKHAEGPFIEDHLRLILMQAKAIEQGELKIAELPEFKTKLETLSAEDQALVRAELERTEKLVREHSAFFEIFAVYHDLAKPDTVGFTSKPYTHGEALGFISFEKIKPKPKKMTPDDEEYYNEQKYDHQHRLKKLYYELIQGFAEKHPELLTKPAEFQNQFFQENGISLSYLGHEPESVNGSNREDVEKAMEDCDLTEDERQIMIKLIELHIEPHSRMTTADPKQFAGILKKMEGLPRDSREVMRLMRAASLLDVLGTKLAVDDGSRLSQVDRSVNLILAERAYDQMLAEEAKKAAFKEAMKAAGLTSEWMMSELGIKGKSIGEVQRAIETAVTTGKLELPSELEVHRAALEERLATLRSQLEKK